MGKEKNSNEYTMAAQVVMTANNIAIISCLHKQITDGWKGTKHPPFPCNRH